MTVCLDTNVLLQIFGRHQPCHAILRALLDGRLTLAVSTEILLEYEEVTTKLSGAERWQQLATRLICLVSFTGTSTRLSPNFVSTSSPPILTTTNSLTAPSLRKRTLSRPAIHISPP
jgi:predicted nucleic acid-binding protein